MLRASLLLLSLLGSAATLIGQQISVNDAAKHIGEHATVCGPVMGSHTAESVRGKPTFVNMGKAYPHQLFTVVFWESDAAKIGSFPTSGNVCVTGKIEEYKGKPQIVLHDAKDWSVPAPAAK